MHYKFEFIYASLRFRRNQREGDRDSGGGIICLSLIKGRGTTKWWMRLPSQHKIKDLSLFVMLTRYYLIRQLPGDIPATATFPGRGRQNGGFAANHTIDEQLDKLKFAEVPPLGTKQSKGGKLLNLL